MPRKPWMRCSGARSAQEWPPRLRTGLSAGQARVEAGFTGNYPPPPVPFRGPMGKQGSRLPSRQCANR